MKNLGKLQLPSGLKGQANALLSASRFPQPGMELARGTCAEPCGAGALRRPCSIRTVAAVGCSAGSTALWAAGGGLMQGRYLSCASSITGLQPYLEGWQL